MTDTTTANNNRQTGTLCADSFPGDTREAGLLETENTTSSDTDTSATSHTRIIYTEAILSIQGVDKTFTMHLQGGQHLAVLHQLTFQVHPGECVVLGGPSGAGKSTVLKMVYGNYSADAGSIVLRTPRGPVDLATASPRAVLAARGDTMGYVSQFLRAVPRVPALHVVAEPLIERGVSASEAEERAAALLTRVSIPERLWKLPPATFSGGEQQRVNIARGFLPELPFLLLDEPTASLDARNRDVVVELIEEKKAVGVGMLGIFHDAEVRQAVADRTVDVEAFTPTPDVSHRSVETSDQHVEAPSDFAKTPESPYTVHSAVSA